MTRRALNKFPFNATGTYLRVCENEKITTGSHSKRDSKPYQNNNTYARLYSYRILLLYDIYRGFEGYYLLKYNMRRVFWHELVYSLHFNDINHNIISLTFLVRFYI